MAIIPTVTQFVTSSICHMVYFNARFAKFLQSTKCSFNSKIKLHFLLEMFIQDAHYVGRIYVSASWAQWRAFLFPVPCNNSMLSTNQTLHAPGRQNFQKYHPQTSTSIQQCHCPREVTSYSSNFCYVSKMPWTFMLTRAKNSQVHKGKELTGCHNTLRSF